MTRPPSGLNARRQLRFSNFLSEAIFFSTSARGTGAFSLTAAAARGFGLPNILISLTAAAASEVSETFSRTTFPSPVTEKT